MSTLTMTRKPLTTLFWLAVLLAFLFSGYIIYHHHAVEQHGMDAIQVRYICRNSDPFQIWQVKWNDDRYHCLYHKPDGGIADQIVELDSKGWWHEISSFTRTEKTLADIMDNLVKQARIVFWR